MLGIGVCVDFFRAAHQLRQPAGRGVQLPAAVVQPADRERGGIAVIAQQPGLVQGAQRPAGAGQRTAVHRARRPAAVPEAVAAERHLRHMLGGVEGAGCGVGPPSCRKALPVRSGVGRGQQCAVPQGEHHQRQRQTAQHHSGTTQEGGAAYQLCVSLSASLSLGSTSGTAIVTVVPTCSVLVIFQLCPVRPGNTGTERQPDAAAACGPAAGLVHHVKCLGHAGQVGGGYAAARVGNSENCLPGAALTPQGDGRALDALTGALGVEGQVAQHIHPQAAVYPHTHPR